MNSCGPGGLYIRKPLNAASSSTKPRWKLDCFVAEILFITCTLKFDKSRRQPYLPDRDYSRDVKLGANRVIFHLTDGVADGLEDRGDTRWSTHLQLLTKTVGLRTFAAPLASYQQERIALGHSCG